jgi:hypothetical protein
MLQQVNRSYIGYKIVLLRRSEQRERTFLSCASTKPSSTCSVAQKRILKRQLYVHINTGRTES